MNPPKEYIEYLRSTNIKEGDIDVFPYMFELWPEEKIELWNKEYEVPKYLPGYLGFAGSGGGELLAFDNGGRILAFPMIGMEPEIGELVAESWKEFEDKIEESH